MSRTCVPEVELESALSHPLEIASNHTLISPSWEENDCYGILAVDKCKAAGGTCKTVTEGGYLANITCTE